jgi:general secretion pathway protein K
MNFRFSILDFGLVDPPDCAAGRAFPKSKIENRKSKISRESRGSVLVIVMITLLFATFALIAFIEKATNDLLVEQREAETKRLRMEAYSALEVTLAVLEDFRQVGNGLHSPAEGWSDPLAFAGYTPTEGRTVEISFEDESGKISLPHTDAATLSRLFQTWDVTKTDADTYADALMGWMQRGHVYSSSIQPDYEQQTPAYEPPLRPLRSYQELAAIDTVREKFYDADGRPNDLWHKFGAAVSLLNFTKPNINGAKPDALLALGQFELSQQQNVNDFITGTGNYTATGPGYFQNMTDAQRIAGPNGNLGAFATTISALRIFITVHDGQSQFRLAAVVTPQGGGATTVTTTATATRAEASANANRTVAQPQNQPNATQQNARQANATTRQTGATRSLNYPFTLLEIRENDEIPQLPAPPPTT